MNTVLKQCECKMPAFVKYLWNYGSYYAVGKLCTPPPTESVVLLPPMRIYILPPAT